MVVSIDVTGTNFANRRPVPGLTADGHQLERAERGDEPEIGFGFSVGKRLWQRSKSIEAADRRKRNSASVDRNRSFRLEKYAPASPATVVQPRGRTTVRQLKKRGRQNAVGEEFGLCSWRHSLCTASQSLDDDIGDLWAEIRPTSGQQQKQQRSAIAISGLRGIDKASLCRSQSLPRSFGRSLQRLLQSSRTVAAADDESHDTSIGSEEMTLASRRRRNKSKSASVCIPDHVDGERSVTGAAEVDDNRDEKRSKSLERLTSRRSSRRRSTPRLSLTTVQNVTVTATGGDKSSDDNREVYVEIPDKPWTKPFATVKLRPQSKTDIDGYQSSSGKSFTLSPIYYFLPVMHVISLQVSTGNCKELDVLKIHR